MSTNKKKEKRTEHLTKKIENMAAYVIIIVVIIIIITITN
jgi:hypothetical protein